MSIQKPDPASVLGGDLCGREVCKIFLSPEETRINNAIFSDNRVAIKTLGARYGLRQKVAAFTAMK